MKRLFLFIFLQVLIIKIIIIVSVYAEDKVFSCKPVMASVPLENGEYYFEKDSYEKTPLINKLTVKEIVNKGGYWLPTVLEMHKPNGNHTIMKLEAFKPDAVLDDEIFTESFLIQKN